MNDDLTLTPTERALLKAVHDLNRPLLKQMRENSLRLLLPLSERTGIPLEAIEVSQTGEIIDHRSALVAEIAS